MKHNVSIFCFSFLCLTALPSQSAPLFSDSFESGDRSATNSAGFKWSGSGENMSVVTSTEVVYRGNASVSVPRLTASPASTNWSPKAGKHSLRFRYKAGQNQAEQRFNMGGVYPEIWIRYWLRVPTNFQHGTSNPTNTKLFALWMDDYSSAGQGPNVVWTTWNNGSGGSNAAFTYKDGPGVLGKQRQHKPWIQVPADRGRWMQIVLHARASSGQSTNDALIETYRRWEGESKFAKIHELAGINMPFPAGGPKGWNAGYIQGWINASHNQDTEWLLDDFTLSTTSLLDGSSAATTPTPDDSSPPLAPQIK